MVPSNLILLDTMPTTATGKLDRRKLQELSFEEQKREQDEFASLSEMEKTLQNYFEQFVGLEIPKKVDIFDNGVDSVIVMLVAQKLRKIGVLVALKIFFRFRTIEKICQNFNKENKAIKIEENKGSHDRINLNHIQQRMLFLMKMGEPVHLAFRIWIKGELNRRQLLKACNFVILNNTLLRSFVQRIQESYFFQPLSATECYISLESPTVQEDHLVQISLAKLDIGTWRLDFKLNHLICDARSLTVMTDQIIKSYFGDKVSFENSFLQPSTSTKILEKITYKPLFADSDLGVTKIFRESLVFDEKAAAKLHKCSIFDLFAHSFAKSLCQTFKLEDLMFGVTFSNRNEHNWNTISMLANTLPISVSYQKLSVEFVAELVRKRAEMSNIPLTALIRNGKSFDFVINYHHSAAPKNWKVGSFELQTEDIFQETPQFPLSLTIFRSSEDNFELLFEYSDALILEQEVLNVFDILKKNLTQSEVMDTIIEIFSKTLKCPVDRNSNFFDLGGHSLLAMTAVDQLCDNLKVIIPLKLIFDNPKVQDLAEEIDRIIEINKKVCNFKAQMVNEVEDQIKKTDENQENTKQPKREVEPKEKKKMESNGKSFNTRHGGTLEKEKLKREVNKDIHAGSIQNLQEEPAKPDEAAPFRTNFPLSSQQLQMFYLSELDLGTEYQLPFIQVFPKSVDISSIHRALLSTMQEQAVFRTSFHFDSNLGTPIQIINSITRSYIALQPIEVEKENEVNEKIRELCHQKISLSGEVPPVRANILITSSRVIAFLHLHHIISDARSTQLTNQSIAKFMSSDQSPRRLQNSYVDYCIESKEIKIEDGYLEKVATNSQRNAWESCTPQVRKLDISKEQVHKSNCSPFTVFLKAISKAMSSYSKSGSINIAFPFANRNQSTDQICGYFLNNLVVSIDTDDDLQMIASKVNDVITFNYSFAGLQKSCRRISKDETLRISDVYVNCRYDLEYDETDDENLLSLVPLKCHFAVEIRGRFLRSDDVIAVVGKKSPRTILRCLSVVFAGGAYAPFDEKNLNRKNLPNNLAYVVSTSGTTGEPKGVCIEHRSVANLCFTSTQDFSVKSSDVIYQFTNFIFDNSVLEIMMTVSNGAKMIVEEEPFDPNIFSELITRKKISHCLLFPSLVSTFNDEQLRSLAKLRYWIVGGEVLPQKLLDKALSVGVSVIQNYGPTETTAYAVSRRMRRGDASRTIGKAVPNTFAVIGENSELWIGGVGRMRGVFYKTGDLCSTSEAGDIVFQGRTDSQIKIRGFRVELGEIESCIEELENVQKCVAIFDKEFQQVFAFVVPKQADLETIKVYCEENLETHKRPSKIISLEAFPVTSNSKIDKEKLLKRTFEVSVPTPEGEDVEQKLRRIWEEVLGTSDFTSTDHFYLIGGHSLLLMKLRHSISSKFDLNPPISELLPMLKFCDMVNYLTSSKKSMTYFETHEKTSSSIFVFFPALYGGCTAYSFLVECLRKDAGTLILLEEEFGNSLEDLGTQYRNQINRKVNQKEEREVIFIGASAAGTMAFETAKHFRRIRLVMIDAGTFYKEIGKLSYHQHYEDLRKNLQLYEVDATSIEEMAESSWKLLQMLRTYVPKNSPHRISVFSIDGSDLGWKKYCEEVNVEKIGGDHLTMMGRDHAAGLAEKIRKFFLIK
ncbi:unnamed protein product [Caenorhabditis auriculariae]|uniref:Carrier domain-containing protein n=1 Tax=Caenorhabditis auriculariae TaxID=2777116 RepID=A0A8S1HI59_9PELO|nr:unnamed protein product [Caenorhabditis auriculariae]